MRQLPPLQPAFPFNLLVVDVLIIAIIVVGIIVLFTSNLYNRLSTRITILIFASGVVTLILALTFNEITHDTVSPPWLRQLQIASIVLGGPVVLGIVTARFVRRPLRQFSDAVASLKASNYTVQLHPTNIHEFDEVFSKFNDLTKRLQHEEKLRKDLVSDTSHELNTPLSAMIGQLTAMQENKYPINKQRITELKDQAERLAELVRQLDAYTQARMPNPHQPEDIAVKQFCQQLIDHFSVELQQKGIKTKLQIADNLVIRTNRDALQKILTNLIQNALRYSRATELTITATAKELLFSDNGKGVPKKSLPYLFERFYRVDTSRNRAFGGLGLGLAIVKEIVEQQGWRIHAKNARPGLTLTLTFS
jgi:two-component system sensor histidine kinase BaeS